MTWGVILDRDGTINEAPPTGDYLCDPTQVLLLPGVDRGIAALNSAGAVVVVATNQRGVALGRCAPGDVDAVNAEIARKLRSTGARVDGWYVCPHDLNSCECRKPADGLVRQAIADHGLEPRRSWIVGDRDVDVLAGKPAGLSAILIAGGDVDQSPRARELHVAYAHDLECAVETILYRLSGTTRE